MNPVRNLFAPALCHTDQEVFETLLQTSDFLLERILSEGHATPEGRWLNQDQDEWVLLLEGAAALRIEGQRDPIVLRPGDYVLLAAHQKHRVEWTARDKTTYWLAIHFPSPGPQSTTTEFGTTQNGTSGSESV